MAAIWPLAMISRAHDEDSRPTAGGIAPAIIIGHHADRRRVGFLVLKTRRELALLAYCEKKQAYLRFMESSPTGFAPYRANRTVCLSCTVTKTEPGATAMTQPI
jgi:hypothetical protein